MTNDSFKNNSRYDKHECTKTLHCVAWFCCLILGYFFFFLLWNVSCVLSSQCAVSIDWAKRKTNKSVESKANLVFDNLKVYKQITNISVSFLTFLANFYDLSTGRFLSVDVNITRSTTPINELNISAIRLVKRRKTKIDIYECFKRNRFSFCDNNQFKLFELFVWYVIAHNSVFKVTWLRFFCVCFVF